MLKQIKIFKVYSTYDLENEVNLWLSDHIDFKILNIFYQLEYESNDYSCIIMYTP